MIGDQEKQQRNKLASYLDPSSNGGKNFWSTPVAAAMGKVQSVTQPIYNAYQNIFPNAPVAKAFESARTGNPMEYSDQDLQNLAEGMSVMGGMKNVSKEIYENALAKRIGRLAVEAGQRMGLSIDGVHDVYQLAQKALGLSEKQVYKYKPVDLLNDMVTNLSENQDFVFRQLPMKNLK